MINPTYRIVIEHEVIVRDSVSDVYQFLYGKNYLSAAILSGIFKRCFPCPFDVNIPIAFDYLACFYVYFITVLILFGMEFQNPARAPFITAQYFQRENDFIGFGNSRVF